MDSNVSSEELYKGGTPSLLDLLKLERMWVNEPDPELETKSKRRQQHSSSKTHQSSQQKTETRERPGSTVPTRFRNKSMSSTAIKSTTQNAAPVMVSSE